jgi:hypothetical protein
MSELWAQFSLNLYNTSEGYSANLTPLDDQANSVQTIDGQTYPLSVSTGIAASQSQIGQASPQPGQGIFQELSVTANGQTYPSPDYRLWTPSVSARPVSPSYDPTPLNNVTPVLFYLTKFPQLGFGE